MKLTAILLLAACLQVSAHTEGQSITLSAKNVSVKQVFREIRKQANFNIMVDEALLEKAGKVNIDVRNARVEEVLKQCFRDQLLDYSIVGNTVVIKKKTVEPLIIPAEIILAPVRITGKVVDENGNPLQGANVLLKGTTTGTSTNEKGEFFLDITNTTTAILILSFVGMETQEIALEGRANIPVILKLIIKQEEALILVGYNSQKKNLLTTSVSKVDFTDEMRTMPTASVSSLLEGRIPSVNLLNINRLPGSNYTITIGTKSSYATVPPSVLFVIDGRVAFSSNEFNNLSPNEIESVTVLKDAAAAAVYGARAAGGVILVTTRKGSATGKPTISYSVNTGFDKRGKNADRTSAVETGEIYNRVFPTTDPYGWKWTQNDLDTFKTINNGWGYDLLDLMYQNPVTTTHNLSISGGTPKNVTYFVGGSYFNQTSFLPNLSFKRYNLRANISTNVSKNIQFSAGVGISLGTGKNPPLGVVYTDLLLYRPDETLWTNAGLPLDFSTGKNPGATQRGDGGYSLRKSNSFDVNLSTTYTVPFIKGLTATAKFSTLYANAPNTTYTKNYNLYVTKKTGNHIISTNDADILTVKKSTYTSKDQLAQSISWNNSYQLNLQLNYQHSFKKGHNVNGTLVYERSENTANNFSGTAETFPAYQTDQFWAASTDRANSFINGTLNNKNGRKSWIGQFGYNFKEKYVANFAYRYDGSMNFAPDKRWGLFPSGSAGWIVSKEPFFKVKGIDMLKIRASVGLTGNDAVGGYQWQEAYNTAASTYFGTTPASNYGITYGNVVNKDLTWEKTTTKTIGIDINFLKNFTASLGYRSTITTDIYGSRNLPRPATYSLTFAPVNYGKASAKEYEASVGYNKRISDVIFSVNVNAAYGAGKYLVIDESNLIYDYQKKVGKDFTQMAGYVIDHIIRTQEDLTAFMAKNPLYNLFGLPAAVGQIAYKDISGIGGIPDGKIDAYDQTIFRKNNNPVNLGLNVGVQWKGLSISATFSARFNQWANFNNLFLSPNLVSRLWKPIYNDSWTSANTNATYPAIGDYNDPYSSYNYQFDSPFWWKDASYFKLNFLSVGYAIPSKYYAKIGLSAAKISFSGSNLFTLSKFKSNYYDPIIGTGFGYPVMKTFNFGLNVSF